MARLDAFSAQIVAYVRNMPDEAILELVRNQLGVVERAMRSPTGRPAATTSTRTRRKRRGRRRTSGAEREALMSSVERVVKASKGLSASEIASRVKAPQSRVSAAVRELKKDKRIYQGGDRRFARYAADAKTAAQASARARKGKAS
jgi:hypothetical protein